MNKPETINYPSEPALYIYTHNGTVVKYDYGKTCFGWQFREFGIYIKIRRDGTRTYIPWTSIAEFIVVPMPRDEAQ